MPEENLANRVYYTCLSPGVRKLQLRTPQAPERLSAPEAKGGVQFWGEGQASQGVGGGRTLLLHSS